MEIVSASLASGAYRWPVPHSCRVFHVHLVQIDEDRMPVRTFCRVKVENVLPDFALYDRHKVTCPTCIARGWKLLKF